MKKIIKIIGIIGLAIAILTPFVELPTVKAAADGCETHLQNYLFLDVTNNTDQPCGVSGDQRGCLFEQYIQKDSKGNTGYTTYGLFEYTFSDVTNMDVTAKVHFNNLTDPTSLLDYWNYHATVKSYSNTSGANHWDDPGFGGKYFVARNTQILQKTYKTNTILLHGKWQSATDKDIYSEISQWNDLVDTHRKNSIQALGLDNSKLKVTLNGATYNGTSFSANSSVSFNQQNAGDYFKAIMEGKNTAGVYTDSATGKKYIPLQINRKFEDGALNDVVFGIKIDNVYYVFSKDAGNIGEAAGAKKSYEAFKDYKTCLLNLKNAGYTGKGDLHKEDGKPLTVIEVCGTNSKAKEISGTTLEASIPNERLMHPLATSTDYNENVDVKVENEIFWPFVMSVEYTLCPKTTGDWILKYDDNVDDTSVNNMPNPIEVKEKIGKEIKLSGDKPSRKDWTFKNWCDNANGSGTCYDAGATVKSPDASKTITLYAQWVKPGTEKNKDTGVVSYVIGFVAVGLVAGGIYLISRKKNIFKQI